MINSLLIIDDDSITTKMLSAFLRDSHINVSIASNEEEGLNLLKSKSFDMALVDIILDVDKTSLEIIKFLSDKENTLNYNLPVVIMSAFLNKEIAANLKKKKFNLIRSIKKPISKNKLDTILNSLPSKSALLLDPDQDMLKFIKVRLEKHGFDVIITSTTDDYIYQIKNKKFLFSIINYDDLDSKKTITALNFNLSNENTLNSNIENIVMSNSEHATVFKNINSQVNIDFQYLKKPLDTIKLIEMINEFYSNIAIKNLNLLARK